MFACEMTPRVTPPLLSIVQVYDIYVNAFLVISYPACHFGIDHVKLYDDLER